MESDSGTRRKFLVGTAALAAATLIPTLARARPVSRLKVLSLHTGERASVAYRIDGVLQPEALGTLDSVLRDHRTGDILEIDRTLFDLMRRLAQRLETDAPSRSFPATGRHAPTRCWPHAVQESRDAASINRAWR